MSLFVLYFIKTKAKLNNKKLNGMIFGLIIIVDQGRAAVYWYRSSQSSVCCSATSSKSEIEEECGDTYRLSVDALDTYFRPAFVTEKLFCTLCSLFLWGRRSGEAH
jgi:hypothetical protein